MGEYSSDEDDVFEHPIKRKKNKEESKTPDVLLTTDIKESNKWDDFELKTCKITFTSSGCELLTDNQVIPQYMSALLSADIQLIINDFNLGKATVDAAKKRLDTLFKDNKIDRSLKMLLNYYYIAITSNDYNEPNVDIFVSNLLNYIEFADDTYTTSTVCQITTDCVVANQMLKIRPDVSIVYQSPYTFNKNIQLLTCEDKTSKNKVSTRDHRAQAVSQMLAAYQTNYANYTKKPELLKLVLNYEFPFITVKGSVFTFFLVDSMTEQYLKDVQTGTLTDKDELNIYVLGSSLNFSDLQERTIIFKLLLAFKYRVLSYNKQLLSAETEAFKPKMFKFRTNQ